MTCVQPSTLPRPPLRQLGTYAMLAGVGTLILMPVVWLVITSFKRDVEYLTCPITWVPAVPQWGNYVAALTIIPFFTYVGNSLVLGLTYTVLCVFTSAMAGYAFARFALPARNVLFTVVVALLMIPQIVTVLPQFILFSRLQLTNSYWPWVLWGLSASPFHIFLFRQFFAAFPKELEEAAEIDGCGPTRIFWQMFLPNAQAVLATSAIFNFTWVWGDWFTPLLFLGDANTTLAVKLATAYVNPQGQPLIPITLAACVLYAMPPIVLFFLAQRYILQGVVTSGLKG